MNPSTLIYTFLVLTGPLICSASYISTCSFFGRACGYRLGDFEIDAPYVLSANDTSDADQLGVSCGSSAQNATQNCSHTAVSPDLNKSQCYSLYNLNESTGARQLVIAGCVLNHALELCTAHTCNFSRVVSGRSVHYCCCHSSDECNRGGIIGGPTTGPTAQAQPTTTGGAAVSTQSDTRINGFGSAAVVAIVLGSLLGVCLISEAALIIQYRFSKKRSGLGGRQNTDRV